MSLVGDSPPWRTSLLSVYDTVRAAIMRAWPTCVSRIRVPNLPLGTPASTRQRKKEDLEDPITRDLVRRLKQDGEIRGRFHVESQREMIEPSLSLSPDPKSYLDIAIVFFVSVDEVCLTLECKRLNVVRSKGRGKATLAREYVEKGMMRFVNGQYSSENSLGGMIGYVMDGDIAAAHEAVIKKIDSTSALLCSSGTIQILKHPDYFSTVHNRTPITIELRHQLLAAK